MWDDVANYYEMVAKTVKDQAVKAALSIAYIKANRMEDAEKLCKHSSMNRRTIFFLIPSQLVFLWVLDHELTVLSNFLIFYFL